MKTLPLPNTFVLLDTEYTAWDGSWQRGWTGPGEFKEIIQVGMIRVGPGLIELESKKIYVKPVKNPVLSDYIKNLTHITQDEVDIQGVSLEACVADIQLFLGSDPAYSYGLDEVVVKENCDLIGIPYTPGLGRILDVRDVIFPALAEIQVSPEGYTSGTLVSALGGNMNLEAHDAVNDMRNLLEAIRRINTHLDQLN
jgi:inhibitor of KinA sporulation pathway (predicted exonuclease)